jgi:hypothetical protein
MPRALAQVRNYTLFLFSANRDATVTSSNMTFIPHGAIYTNRADTENVKISLLAFAFTASWYTVTDANNRLRVLHGAGFTDVVVPPGSWPLDRLACATSTGPIAIAYNSAANRFTFSHTGGASIALVSTNASYEVWGFAPTDAPSGAQVTSTRPVEPRWDSELYVRLENATQGDGCLNYDNMSSRQLQPSTLLGVVPITAAPFHAQFTSEPALGEACGMYVANQLLHSLEISIFDAQGRLATWVPDWKAIVKIDVVEYKASVMLEVRDAIVEGKETLERLLIMKMTK